MVVQSCMLCYFLVFANVLKNIFYKYYAICNRFIEQYTGFTQATTQLITVDMPWVIGQPFVFKTKVKFLSFLPNILLIKLVFLSRSEMIFVITVFFVSIKSLVLFSTSYYIC